MNRTFQSKLAPYIEGLIRERQTCGYLFNLYASHLFRFDSFIVAGGFDCGELNEALFSAWAAQLETENQNSRNSRVHAVCELADYMESLGRTVFHPYKLGRKEYTTPSIPTKDELMRLFSHIDRSRVNHKCFERFNIEYPILIRLYYHCRTTAQRGGHAQKRGCRSPVWEPVYSAFKGRQGPNCDASQRFS